MESVVRMSPRNAGLMSMGDMSFWDGSHYGQRQIEFVHRLSCFRHPKFQDKSAGAEHKGDEHGLGQGIVQADEDNSQDGNS